MDIFSQKNGSNKFCNVSQMEITETRQRSKMNCRSVCLYWKNVSFENVISDLNLSTQWPWKYRKCNV